MKGRRMYDDGGEVANTILQQLGGAGRLRVMTGAYNFYDLGDGLSFKIKNPKANYIKIKLTPMDLYDVEVGRVRGTTYKVVQKAEGLYFDQLRPFIEKATGMYLSLRKGGQIEKAIKQKLSKSFDLPLQMAVYVPSTKDKNVVVSKQEMDERVLEVKSYLAELFGGFNSVKVEGGFESSDKGLIEEDAVRIVAFASQDGFISKFEKLISKIKIWCKEWSQESIGLEFENDLFYIESGSQYSKGGMIEHKTDDGETLKYKIDKDEMSLEVDFPTMEYLSENGIVMKREARKLKDTYIFWYDQINNSSREELEEVLKVELPISGDEDDYEDDDYEDYARGGSISDAAYKSRMKKFGFQPYGKTKGKFKITYKADGKPQSETWDSMEMALNTAKRYSKIDEFSDIRIFDESGKDISNKWLTYMARGGEVYKLGDKWSDVFDYKGMLKMGLKAQTSWGSKKLRKLYDSYEDVNYHKASTNLWNAIESIKKSEEVQSQEAKDAYILAADNYIERFHDDVIEEMLSQMEDVKEEPEDDWKKIQDSYKVNVYGRMSAKDYYADDTKSSALKWYKLNRIPMSRARAEKFAEPYITLHGRSNIHIGGIEYGGMGRGSRRFTRNLGYEDGGQVDLFEQMESLPDEVQSVLGKYSDGESYLNLENLLEELKPLGYTFEYGLDAVPFGLTKMADGGMMADGYFKVEEKLLEEDFNEIKDSSYFKNRRLFLYDNTNSKEFKISIWGSQTFYDPSNQQYKVVGKYSSTNEVIDALNKIPNRNYSYKVLKSIIEFNEDISKLELWDDATAVEEIIFDLIPTSKNEEFADGGMTDKTSTDKLNNLIREESIRQNDVSTYVVYLSSDGQGLKIGEYENLVPYSAQADRHGDFQVIFEKDRTLYIFTNSVTEIKEDRESFEKYSGLINLYIPLTDKLSSEIIKKVFDSKKMSDGGKLFSNKSKKFIFLGSDGQPHGLNYNLIGIKEDGTEDIISEHTTQSLAERKAKKWSETAYPNYTEWRIDAVPFSDGGDIEDYKRWESRYDMLSEQFEDADSEERKRIQKEMDELESKMHKSERRYGKGGKVKKRVRFVDKVESIADRLEGTKVPKRLKKDYGGKYNREEAEEAGRRIAGAQLRDRKMADGGQLVYNMSIQQYHKMNGNK